MYSAAEAMLFYYVNIVAARRLDESDYCTQHVDDLLTLVLHNKLYPRK